MLESTLPSAPCLWTLTTSNDKEKGETFSSLGSCAALVHLVKDRLKKAMQKVPACDQVTVAEVNEFPELETTEKNTTRNRHLYLVS
jgi:hypothetical protein